MDLQATLWRIGLEQYEGNSSCNSVTETIHTTRHMPSLNGAKIVNLAGGGQFDMRKGVWASSYEEPNSSLKEQRLAIVSNLSVTDKGVSVVPMSIADINSGNMSTLDELSEGDHSAIEAELQERRKKLLSCY